MRWRHSRPSMPSRRFKLRLIVRLPARIGPQSDSRVDDNNHIRGFCRRRGRRGCFILHTHINMHTHIYIYKHIFIYLDSPWQRQDRSFCCRRSSLSDTSWPQWHCAGSDTSRTRDVHLTCRVLCFYIFYIFIFISVRFSTGWAGQVNTKILTRTYTRYIIRSCVYAENCCTTPIMPIMICQKLWLL